MNDDITNITCMILKLCFHFVVCNTSVLLVFLMRKEKTTEQQAPGRLKSGGKASDYKFLGWANI